MSKQVSLTATLCTFTMALFALSALAGGFESDLAIHAPFVSTGLSATLAP